MSVGFACAGVEGGVAHAGNVAVHTRPRVQCRNWVAEAAALPCCRPWPAANQLPRAFPVHPPSALS
eukprot:359773-Chlamydomonas_euryale.AAC.6